MQPTVQPSQQNVQSKAPNSQQSSTQVQPKVPPSEDDSTNDVGKVNKGKYMLQIHPSSLMLDTNCQRRFTRSQAQELDQVVKRLENLHLYDDEIDGDPTGDMVNFSLMTSVELERSCYVHACINDVWVKAMQKEINSIKKNDT